MLLAQHYTLKRHIIVLYQIKKNLIQQLQHGDVDRSVTHSNLLINWPEQLVGLLSQSAVSTDHFDKFTNMYWFENLHTFRCSICLYVSTFQILESVISLFKCFICCWRTFSDCVFPFEYILFFYRKHVSAIVLTVSCSFRRKNALKNKSSLDS